MSKDMNDLLLNAQRTVDQDLSQFVAMLADMVESYISQNRLVIPTSTIDADRWLRRHIWRKESREMDNELTTQLLGTNKFTQIA